MTETLDVAACILGAGPVGATLAETPGVHAVTDVTGFGLLGHALEMARGSGLTAELSVSAAPRLPGAEALAQAWASWASSSPSVSKTFHQTTSAASASTRRKTRGGIGRRPLRGRTAERSAVGALTGSPR